MVTNSIVETRKSTQFALVVVVVLVAKLCPTLATLWTITHQAPPSMGIPRQEYLRVLPFPSPGDLPDSEIAPASHALADRFFTTEPPGKALKLAYLLAFE